MYKIKIIENCGDRITPLYVGLFKDLTEALTYKQNRDEHGCDVRDWKLQATYITDNDIVLAMAYAEGVLSLEELCSKVAVHNNMLRLQETLKYADSQLESYAKSEIEP